MNCTIDLPKFSYTSYSEAADNRTTLGWRGRAGIVAIAADDTIVTPPLCHAPEGLAKCIALGVDGAKAYTTVA
jgi:hypothetical protein